MFQWNIVFWILFLSSLVAISTANVAIRNRHAVGGWPFFWMLIAITEWCLVSALEAAAVDLHLKIFFSTLEYIGSGFTALFFLFFASEYTGKTAWITKVIRIHLWVVPLINVVIAATNHWHHLVWTDFSPADWGNNQFIYHHGILFYVIIFFVYAYLATATLLLVSHKFKVSLLQKRQTRILLIAFIIPLISSLVYIADLSPIPGLNITPLSLVVTSILILHAVFRDKLLNLVPIAREQLLEQMWEAMIVLDNQNRIVDISKSAESLFNISINQMIGESLFKIIPNKNPVAKALQSCEQSQIEMQFGNNPEKYLEFRISPLSTFDKRKNGFLLVCHDITKRKVSEIQREKLILDLKEANDTKNRFFSILSHDLRSPFNNIVSFVRLINENMEDISKEELMDLTNELYKNTKITNAFLENLLLWGRSQTGVLRFKPKAIPLKDLYDSVHEILMAQTTQKSIKLKCHIPEDLWIWADYHMTSTVIRNLTSNAIKFSHPKSEVCIKAVKADDIIQIKVIDQGLGMDEKVLHTLFRLDEAISMPGTQNEKGSGLGLILCRELIEKQGGTIQAESQPDVGSTFTITLPAAQEVQSDPDS